MTLPITLGSMLLFSACSNADSIAANQALAKMHARMMEIVRSNPITLEQPRIAKTTTELSVQILPASKAYKGNANFIVKTSMLSDAVNPKDPRLDATMTISASADVPSETANPTTEKPDRLSLSTIISARSMERALAMNFAKVEVTAPTFLPVPFVLPSAMSSVWYGMTFAELDAVLAEQRSVKGAVKPPPIEDILTNMLRGFQLTPVALEKLGNNMHLWNGIKILPGREGMGLIQIEVKSDKRKIRDSVRALLAFVEEMSGSSWKSQMQTNTELTTMVNSLMKNDAEFVRTMGSVQGVVSADAETFDFREFNGDIFNEKNVQTATIDIRRETSGDFSIRLTNIQSKEDSLLMKQGDNFSLEVGNKQIMRGILSSSRVQFDVFDPKNDIVLGSADVSIISLSGDRIELSKGVIEFTQKKLVVTIPSFSIVLSNSLKDMSMKIVGRGTLDGKPLFSGDLQMTRTEIAPFTLEAPLFVPFENLRKDFLSAFVPPAALVQ